MPIPLQTKPLDAIRRAPLNAFSLAELLLALAIVTVLVAITVPAVQAFRIRGDSMQCASNLRQIGIAALAQARDRSGLLPDMGLYCSTKAKEAQYSLLPYLDYPLSGDNYRRKTVFTCPASWKANPTETELYRTYAINRYATSSRINQPDDFDKIKNNIPLRLQNVRSPSSMAFFMDGSPRSADPATTYFVDQNYARLSPENTPYLHSEAIHAVFLDGHVEAIKQEDAERELTARTSTTTPFWGSSN